MLAGGAAWATVAIAILVKLVPGFRERVLGRGTAARCLLGALLGIALLALVLSVTANLPTLARTVFSLIAHAGLAAFLLALAANVEPDADILGLKPALSRDLVKGLL